MTNAGTVPGNAPWRLATRPRLAASERARTDGEQLDEQGVVIPRVETYTCSRAHVTQLRFARSAVSPITWECPKCSQPALLDGASSEQVQAATPRKLKEHSEQLHERRTPAQLQALLDEQLARLRAGTLPGVDAYLGRTPHIYRA